VPQRCPEMSKKPLTEIQLRSAQPPQTGRLTIWDGVVKHFGVRITPSGVKTFIVLLGSGRRQAIGRYPVLSLAQAREKAKRILAERTLGRHQTASISWEVGTEKFIDARRNSTRPATVAEYERTLKRYFGFGTTRLSEITKQDLSRKLEKLNEKPSQQMHSLVVCKMFFRWALVQGFIDVDPTAAFKRSRQRKRARVLRDDELQKVWSAAAEQSYPHGTIVQLLILTGQRRGEIAGLRRSWIDERARTVTLPAEITKNGKEHCFPYGDTVAALLETVPRRNSTDLLFPSRASDDRRLSGFSQFKKQMTDGVPNWRLHDLRRTFRTIHGKLGTAPHIGERLINHVAAVASDVEQIYDLHTYLPEMRKAIEAYETELLRIFRAVFPQKQAA
jgi:integrase